MNGADLRAYVTEARDWLQVGLVIEEFFEKHPEVYRCSYSLSPDDEKFLTLNRNDNRALISLAQMQLQHATLHEAGASSLKYLSVKYAKALWNFRVARKRFETEFSFSRMGMSSSTMWFSFYLPGEFERERKAEEQAEEKERRLAALGIKIPLGFAHFGKLIDESRSSIVGFVHREKFPHGIIYSDGRAEIIADLAAFEEWRIPSLQKAAERGDAGAQFELWMIYHSGDGVPQDYQKAAYWIRKAAEQGDAEAQIRLGNMYAEGEGMPKDNLQAAFWYRKVTKQRNYDDVHYDDAETALENMYENAEGIHEEFREAAEQGHTEAQLNLGDMYDNGWAVPEDSRQAAFWYRKAAEQGDAEAQVSLGHMYRYARYAWYTDIVVVPEDGQQAASWFGKAAEQGHAHAQNALGDMYAEGEGVPEDGQQAVFWYRKAAEQGHTDAQRSLGLMYAKGEGEPEKDQQAALWYREAAEQGHAEAQFSLGLMYYTGKSVPQDYQQAASWYRKAAKQGHAGAQGHLGDMYAKGEGVPQNDQQAAFWHQKATEQGDPTSSSS